MERMDSRCSVRARGGGKCMTINIAYHRARDEDESEE
jgi:hypothetical protein